MCIDYLFIVPPLADAATSAQNGSSGADIEVRQILRPAKGSELGAGLPMKGVGASDHLAVGCEVAW